ncbi:phosphotransferase [Paenibacillus aceris]|uniref:Ser/Thr protein kinase RdoA (MazF antagonist) n=1 Tax=Paenibacillus aceris TaxID=869555 RepID=A0ABS4I0M1_9BACL|nr:phosphotransferase [Paenibacillus aceris]MBP1964469.1 Ser/Thr protein kinase RdoA (MazF antagonist) [Paenibacillus aceris]NHW35818.1 phosphotransferase [Paenibacillus aceris]
MQDQLDELVRNYFEDAVYEIASVPFGLTNVTKIVKMNEKRYVLRMYNRYMKHIRGIALEARITSFLTQSYLSFQVPVFQQTLTGNDFVQLSDGTLGAIISFLEGDNHELISLQDAAEIGRVVGEITYALSQFDIGQMDYLGISFLDMYKLHPLASRGAVAAFIESPPFHIPETSLCFYKETVQLVEKNVHLLKKLPEQLVHHDLLIFNLLSQNKRICGVLDFDFVSLDISFMEFAICLNHLLQMTNGSMEMMEAFVKSYSGYRKHNLQELEQLQTLTQIYHLAVLHFYIGQHHGGDDIQQNFNYILNQLLTRDAWLVKHNKDVQQMLMTYLID